MYDNMTGVEQEPSSLEHVRRSDVFPKKMLVSEDDKLRVPFPLLSGEFPEFLGRTADGTVALSNFRMLIRNKDSFINVPLGLIESVEMRDIFYIHVYCKDATVVRCAFSTNETCQDWYKRLLSKTMPCQKIEDVFAFAFFAWCMDRSPGSDPVPESSQQLCSGQSQSYSFTKEVERMEFDLSSAWRYSDINKNFGLCSSYPPEHIVPKSIKDDNLTKVAGFRALRRFPSVVWRNSRNGAVLVRSSQPEIGVFGWRNQDDENLLSAIPLACSLNPGTSNKLKEDSSCSDVSSEDSSTVDNGTESLTEPKKMLIIDCRSYPAALANRAKGGGVECIDYYQSCEIQFMNLPNIHAIRKSFMALRVLCSSGGDQASWLSGLETTKWLQNLSSLMKAAVLVVTVNEKEGRPVLVHCSDGWDRTPQIVSLAELMLDPFYRTVQGFQVLVEREWLQFGHKFSDRCGNGGLLDDPNERCPVFLQWLECIYQLLYQFPCEFEFNEAYLIKLVHHTYSCLFGTFLCNTLEERCRQQIDSHTASVWSLLADKNFINHLYAPSSEHEVLYPASNVQNLHLWASVYLSNNSSFAGPEELPCQQIPSLDSIDSAGLQKTRSCENLLCMNDMNSSLSRRRSDPNITTDLGEQQTQKLLKDAMSGDTSCSSESVKSSENNISLTENGETCVGKTVEGTVSQCSEELNTDQDHSDLDSSKADSNDDSSTQNSPEKESVELLSDDKDRKNIVENGIGKAEENGENKVVENGEGNTSNGHVNGLVNGNDICDSRIDKIDEECNDKDREVEVNGDIKPEDVKQIEKIPIQNGDPDSNRCRMDVGLPTSIQRHLLSGNGDNEMNNHRDSSEERLNGHEDSTESGDNSIETISENGDSSGGDSDILDSVSSGHCNGEINRHNEITTVCISEQNGTVDTDTINKAVTCKIRQRLGNDISAPSLDSSTDTVTEELQNGDSNHTLTPSPNNGPIYKVASLQSLCDKKFSSNKLKTVDQTTSISTSTSDLSDSRVLENGLMNGFPREALLNVGDSVHTSLKLRLMSQTGTCNGTSYRGPHLNTSLTPPLFQSPASPQSRNSTCPPTPATSDGKSIDLTVPRHHSGVQKYLDVDGLTKFKDPIQKQIEKIQIRYEQQLNMMKEENSYLRSILAQHASACNGEAICNLDLKMDSPGTCDMHSIHSNYSNAASDASWDQMDDPEVHVTRWVPDHLVTQCAVCESEFNIWNRKHHCRNCGKIFCHNCCKDTVPLPHQMIHSQERVCKACYREVTNSLTRSIIEMDNGLNEPYLAAAASN